MVGSSGVTPHSQHAAPKAYKSATPALNEKLQRYREDPEALADLHKRVRQHRTASRPVTPESPRPASAPAAGAKGANSATSSAAAGRVSRQQTPRNFVEENASVITPWPCTGALSSRALAAATTPGNAAGPDPDDSESCGSATTSGRSSLAATPRPKSATETLLQAPCQVANPFAHPHQQDGSWSPLASPRPTPAPSNSIISTASNSLTSSIGRLQSNSCKTLTNSSEVMSRTSTSSIGMFRSFSQKPQVDNQRQNLCLKQLGMHIAAKRDASAARATNAAERRSALAEAEQQRRVQLSGRSERLQAERVAAEEAEAAASARRAAQEAWSGVIMATAIATGLAALLEKRRKQGAAALVIAEAYKRSLIRRRQKEFVQLIIRLRRAIKPKLPQLLQAAHQRCAERVLLFLQRSHENNMLLRATQKFKHSISFIQQYWRQIRLIRACQEELLYTAMKQLEQQLVARNASAATQAALASELEASVQGRQRAGRTLRGGSGLGSRAVSGTGAISSSGSQRQRSSNQLRLVDTDIMVEAISGSDCRSNGDAQQQQMATQVTVPYVRGGETLFTPEEFFANDDESVGDPAHVIRATGGVSGSTGSLVNVNQVAAAAAASPHGPIIPRGGYMTGQLTTHVLAIPYVLKLNTLHQLSEVAGSSSSSPHQQPAAGDPDSSVSSRSANSGSAVSCRPRTAGPLSSRSVNNSNRAARPTSAAAAPSTGTVTTGSSVGWYADVIDLEVEARLKDLSAVLPHNIRKQIVCSHLAAARRLFVKEREAYAAAMKHYKNRLELEELKQKLLKEAGINAQISLQPPQRPRMKVLVSKEMLKLLVIEGMDLQHYQAVAAKLATDDAAVTARSNNKHNA